MGAGFIGPPYVFSAGGNNRERVLIYSSVFVASLGLLGHSSASQMESVLAVCLLLAGVLASIVGNKWDLTFFVLAAFTRYELALGVLVFLFAMVTVRRLHRKAVIRALAIAAVLIGFLLVQYHTVIPNAVRAKSAGYPLSQVQAAFALIAWDERATLQTSSSL